MLSVAEKSMWFDLIIDKNKHNVCNISFILIYFIIYKHLGQTNFDIILLYYFFIVLSHFRFLLNKNLFFVHFKVFHLTSTKKIIYNQLNKKMAEYSEELYEKSRFIHRWRLQW